MENNELQVQQKQPVQQNGESTKPIKYFTPAVDIFETEDRVTIIAEMPGVNNKGVDISLEDGVLTIRGHRNQDEEGGRVLLSEYDDGAYLRKFTLAETIDQEKIKASMSAGMLTLDLPKEEPARPKKIEVVAG